ncbi:MAG TPA: hypothetical protein VFG54_13855 [Prolixibacteraceae bacterium]|nr:hypothetical protein [Prolixibacteraceae bacterium]
MKTKLMFSILGLFILIAYGCKKNEPSVSSNEKIELYLIETYSKIGYSYQIDENSVVTKNTPLIYYSDFLSYDSTEYTFEVSDRALEAIKNLNHSVHGLPFAIMANDTLVYTGYFWPSYSSASCDWVVIDPIMASIGKRIQVRLGYPGLVQGHTIEDKRNDERIIRIFKLDNKLK